MSAIPRRFGSLNPDPSRWLYSDVVWIVALDIQSERKTTLGLGTTSTLCHASTRTSLHAGTRSRDDASFELKNAIARRAHLSRPLYDCHLSRRKMTHPTTRAPWPSRRAHLHWSLLPPSMRRVLNSGGKTDGVSGRLPSVDSTGSNHGTLGSDKVPPPSILYLSARSNREADMALLVCTVGHARPYCNTAVLGKTDSTRPVLALPA